LKKFDIQEYTQRRMRELRGEDQLWPFSCPKTDAYTSKRIRELRGETVYWDTEEHKMTAYCSRWIQEHRPNTQSSDRKLLLDNRRLGSYTLGTMGDRDGET